MPVPEVAGIVLAAGLSRRMGSPKPLLEIQGRPLVRIVTMRAIAAGLSPVLVVAGHDHEGIRRALAGLEAEVVVNPDPERPVSASLHCGIAALPASSPAAMVILADMPHVTAAMMSAVRNAAGDAGARLAVSRYGDVMAPPLCFPRALFDELLAWHGEGCGRQVVNRHRDEALCCDWDPSALADLDTPDDLARYLSDLQPDESPIPPGRSPL